MKKWVKSKTMWVNIGVATVSVLTALSNVDFIAAHPQTVAFIGAVVGVVNILLRTVTHQPIGK